ncbi:MAG: MarR family winged helix-turn-helix transcriptional regulator [Xenococcaceae cyanobacterium MO_207.B15]|nr:MarR family winged helix-turn-helix transcriptional regulator [Xenococcaceae cyanobacterium MO_207.B15]
MDNTLLYQLLERIGNLLRAEQRLVGNEFGLQEVHLQVLLYLSQCNRYSNTPLGVTEYLNATKGTVSQSLKVLEKKGYIVKEADAKDRRVVHLILTAQGKKLLKQFIPPSLFTNAIKELSDEQLNSLETQLSLLLVKLQKANQSRSFGVCHTCRFFLQEEDGFRCGLTQESLSHDDSFRICREHE